MRKKILAGIVILSLVASLVGCGESEAQQVETTADTPVVEEAKAEPKPEPEPVVEEKEPEEIEEKAEEVEEEPEKDYSWADEYLKMVLNWHNAHLGDEAENYDMIYMNDDDIPELLLTCDDNSYTGKNLYTYYDEQVSHVKLCDFNGDVEDSTYTIMGRQAQGDGYIEKPNGIYDDTAPLSVRLGS